MADKNIHVSFPPQRLSDSMKNEKWGRLCVDAIIGMSSDEGKHGRSSRHSKQINYDLVNSIFDEEDFKYITDPYKFKEDVGRQPAILQNHNAIRAKIELLKGEEAQLPFNFYAIGKYGEVIRSKDERIQQQVTEAARARLLKGLGLMSPDEPVPTLEEIAKKARTHIDIREKNASHILKDTYERQRLRDKFNNGWEHALIVAEEIYYVSRHKGLPHVRVVNPMNLDFDKDPDLEYIQDGNWVKEEREMSVANIIDVYGDQLKDSDIKKLDNGELGYGLSGAWSMWGSNHIPGAAPSSTHAPGEQIPNFGKNVPEEWIPDKGSRDSATNDKVLVQNVVWRSFRKIHVLVYSDPSTGEPQQMDVDDKFTLTREQIKAGWRIEVEWLPDVWKGTRIGDDIYVDIAPLENQTGKLPYIGYIYNNTNSKATSLVDLVKAHQYTLMAIMYKIMLETAKFKGSRIVYDLAQFPATGLHGMSMDRWLYYAETVGIVLIDSTQEGIEGNMNTRGSFNQWTILNPSELGVVNVLIGLLDKIEAMIGDVMGVSPQRESKVKASETVGGVERSVIQSSAITASLFMKHNEVKRAVLQQVLEVAQLCILEDGYQTQLVVDDAYVDLVKINGAMLSDSEFEVFVTDSMQTAKIKDKLEQLAQAALSADKLNFSEIIKVLQSDSVAEIADTVRAGEQDKYQRDAAAQEAQNKQMQAKIEADAADKQAQREFEANQNQLDRDADIQRETIKALGQAENTDANANGVPDVLEQSKIALAQMQANQKMAMESLKSDEKRKDREIKEKQAQEKLAVDRAKMEFQMANEKLKADMFRREQNQQDQKNKFDLKTKAADLKAKAEAEKTKLKQITEDAKQKELDRKAKIKEKEIDAREKAKDRQAKFLEIQMNARLKKEEMLMNMQMKREELKIKAEAEMMKAKAQAQATIVKGKADAEVAKTVGKQKLQMQKAQQNNKPKPKSKN
jgi:hypothetical protein